MNPAVLTTFIVFGAALIVAAILAAVWGFVSWMTPVVPDGKHTADDWAPGMHGPARKGQATS